MERPRNNSLGFRRIALVGGALAALALLFQHPRADIRILTHDAADTAPARIQTAIDLGVLAISVLVTWTRNPQSY